MCTPRISEGRFINVELGLAQTTGRNCAARIRDLLNILLCKEKLVDLSTQGSILSASNLLGDHLESERSVADPSEKIVWVVGVWTCDDNSRLTGKIFIRFRLRGGVEDKPMPQATLSRQVRCWPRGPTWRSETLWRYTNRWTESFQKPRRRRRTGKRSTGHRRYAWRLEG